MSGALDVRVVDARLGILNVPARMPFRFGVVTIHAAAQAVLELTVEGPDGATAKGYAADFLSYKWFDKSPEKSPQEGSDDLIRAIRRAIEAFRAAGRGTAFGLWRDLHKELEDAAVADGHNRLGGNFGVSMVERAVIDAIGRLTGATFDAMMRGPVLGIDEPSVFADLAPGAITAAMPARPRDTLALRHTIGLVDPLTDADIAPDDRVGDGLPETLADYLRDDGVSYLKVKVSGDTSADLDRLTAIQAVIAANGRPVRITLDGNEQYAALDGFADLVDAIRRTPALQPFYEAVILIEQPVERTAAMAAPLSRAALATIDRPLIIDEADGWTSAFREAIELGYRGVSHKNCKGVFRSFLNQALASHLNATSGEDRYFLSAEDLSVLPVVSLQSDLAAVASLGITHVERNGHHYFHGLRHLSPAEQAAALTHHGDLYRRGETGPILAVRDGAISIASLQTPGFGFAPAPDMNRLIEADDWTFASLEGELE